MIGKYATQIKLPHVLMLAAVLSLFVQQAVQASPFGQGVFGADVPFGSGTSISLAVGSSPSISLTPSGPNLSGSANHVLTVTTTDVVGYRLYVYAATSTNMSSGLDTIPASSNTVAGALAVNTWGYNIDATSDYLGMTSSPKVLKDANGPYKNGDNTTVTYGVLAGPTKGAGEYTVTVTYTAVAKSQ